MGTRHLIAVQYNNEYKIAQYGQWDGYPSGQGSSVLEFLQNVDYEVFKNKLDLCSFHTDESFEDLQKLIDSDEKLKFNWDTVLPWLSRDTGSKILDMVYNSDGLKLKDSLYFAGDSLFCEFAYVIDLDKNTFEVYKGFNKDKLATSERFASIPPDNDKYYQVSFFKCWPLDDLPSIEEFIDECKEKEEE